MLPKQKTKEKKNTGKKTPEYPSLGYPSLGLVHAELRSASVTAQPLYLAPRGPPAGLLLASPGWGQWVACHLTSLVGPRRAELLQLVQGFPYGGAESWVPGFWRTGLGAGSPTLFLFKDFFL